MKDILKILAVVVVSVIAGAYASRCSTEIPNGTAPRECVIDTIPYVDTIPYYLPEAKAETRLGEMRTKVLALPQKETEVGEGSPTPPLPSREGADSVEVIIPITQREYEGEDYRAWVSGYEPRLDSIFVFARRETVTIREPSLRSDRYQERKRWGIGPTIGYGLTPQGLQPYIGISINYNLWNF